VIHPVSIDSIPPTGILCKSREVVGAHTEGEQRYALAESDEMLGAVTVVDNGQLGLL
jgi:hypothetical protein